MFKVENEKAHLVITVMMTMMVIMLLFLHGTAASKSLDGLDAEVDGDIPFASLSSLSSPSLARLPEQPTTPRSPLPSDMAITEEGMVRGAVQGKVQRFLGIPYASAPVMFAYPQAAIRREGVLDCTRFGPQCWQPQLDVDIFSKRLFNMEGATFSNDCLNLNIYRPEGISASAEASKNLPVLVFVHGGSLSMGSPQMPMHDPSELIREHPELIVVTLNYRLGPFGFLDDNYAMLDLREGLFWIQRNIANFGGNPQNITLLAHSAGATLCQILQIALGQSSAIPPQLPPFHKLILMSGGVRTIPSRSVEEAQNDLKHLAALLECPPTKEALLAVGARRIIQVMAQHPLHRIWGPIVGGALLPSDPVNMLREGTLLAVPTLMTTTRDDGSYFITSDHIGPMSNWEEVVRRLILHSEVDQVLQNYAAVVDNTADIKKLAGTLLTDALFKYPALGTVKMLQSVNAPAYYYCFSDRYELSVLRWAGYFSQRYRLGVVHGTDMLLLFANPATSIYNNPTLSMELRSNILRFMTDHTTATSWTIHQTEALDRHMPLRNLWLRSAYPPLNLHACRLRLPILRP